MPLEIEYQSPECAQPWVKHPYQLISWWDVEKFSAETFLTIAETMEKLRSSWSMPDKADQLVSKDLRPYDTALIGVFIEECSKVGMTISCKHMESLKDDPPSMKNSAASSKMEHIFQTVVIEMAQNSFMYIPKGRSAYYGLEQPFGAEVATRFRSASFDAKEAGNCYAAGRWTACVFHLMRVLEIGLSSFAKLFGVPHDHTNWHNIIEATEAKIRNMGTDPTKANDWKEKQELYAQAANSFMFFKDAWRNYTAHARGKYTDDEADGIYRNVRAFMQKLAKMGITE